MVRPISHSFALLSHFFRTSFALLSKGCVCFSKAKKIESMEHAYFRWTIVYICYQQAVRGNNPTREYNTHIFLYPNIIVQLYEILSFHDNYEYKLFHSYSRRPSHLGCTWPSTPLHRDIIVIYDSYDPFKSGRVANSSNIYHKTLFFIIQHNGLHMIDL